MVAVFALLPVTTFASIADLGLEMSVYCPRCYALRRVNPLGPAIRDRQFAGARFICHRCGARGMAQLQPPNALIAGGPVTLLFMWCDGCLWEAKRLLIGEPRWSVAGRFLCSGCGKPVRQLIVPPMGPGGVPLAESVKA